jgi:hypothetical protein
MLASPKVTITKESKNGGTIPQVCRSQKQNKARQKQNQQQPQANTAKNYTRPLKKQSTRRYLDKHNRGSAHHS